MTKRNDKEASYRLLFKAYNLEVDSLRLERNVMARIEARRISRTRLAAFGYGVMVLGALVSAMPAFNYMSDLAAQSGFREYASLLITDGANLAGSWNHLLLSLLESAPISGIVSVLAVLFVGTFSLRKMMEDLVVLKRKEERVPLVNPLAYR